MNYATAYAAAREVLELVSTVCQAVEIVGSVRRHKQEPGDIELLMIPAKVMPIFGDKRSSQSPLLLLLDVLLAYGTLEHRRDKLGRKCWGPKYRRCLYRDIATDLFIVTEPEWGAVMAIRTGPEQFSKALVTRRNLSTEKWPGLLPNDMYCENFLLHDRNGVIPTLTEQDFFSAIDFPHLKPEKRDEWMKYAKT